MYREKTVKAIIPARNEAAAIHAVVREVGGVCVDGRVLFDEVIVCDNDSSDATAKLAHAAGARVVYAGRVGYGSACLAAIAALNAGSEPRCDYVVFLSGDGAEDPAETPSLLDALIAGQELVIGSRALGRAGHGAQSFVQRFGNELATALIRRIWHVPVSDLGPFRAIRYDSLLAMQMRDPDYGWTIEMQVKAIMRGMRMCEVPVSSRKGATPSQITRSPLTIAQAAWKILSTIFVAAWAERRFLVSPRQDGPASSFRR